MLDLAVVVRAAGERTEAACLETLRKQAGGGAVELVRERPFSRALEKSIETAIGLRAKWTVLADADVLFAGQALASIAGEMEEAPGNVYMVNFRVLDRGFGGPAYGVHGYRTEHLAKALRFMDAARRDQRPETRLYKEMARTGHPTLLSAFVAGLHDYEQYYRDLYRKMFVRAFKYGTQMDYMLRRFRPSYRASDEAKVMLWGLMEGTQEKSRRTVAELDTAFYEERSAATLEMLGIAEKPQLGGEPGISVDEVLDAFQPDALYLENSRWIAPGPGPASTAATPRPFLRRVQSRFRAVLRGAPAGQ